MLLQLLLLLLRTVASCLFLVIGSGVSSTVQVQDGQVETVEAVLGRGLTIQCHLPGIDRDGDGQVSLSSTSNVVRSWERWSYQGAGPVSAAVGRTEEEPSRSSSRRRLRHSRHRRLVSSKQEQHGAAALRFASIREEDEGLYRCAGSSISPTPTPTTTISDAVEFNRANDQDDNGNTTSSSSESLTPSDGDDVSVAKQRPGPVTTQTTQTIYGSFIYVRVQVAAVVTDYPDSPVFIHPFRQQDRRKQQQRRRHRLKCLAFGHPTPVIHWRIISDGNSTLGQQQQQRHQVRLLPEEELLDDVGDSSGAGRQHQRGYVRSVVQLDWTRRDDSQEDADTDWQSLNVSCSATNTIAGQKHTDTKMFNLQRVRLMDGQEDEEQSTDDNGENGAGYCGRYTGHICRGQLSNPSSVWYNISSSDQTGGWLNEQLVHGLWDEVVRTLREPCQSAAKKLLCLYAFPECHLDDDGFARRLPLCYEDCMATKQLFCVDDWAQLESNKQRGFYLGSRGHFRLPRCENLPRIGSRSYFMSSSSHSGGGGNKYGLDPPSCSRAHLTQLVPAEVTTSCVKGRGRFYQGNVSVTKDGIACQRWDAQEPHSHNRPPLNIFPEMQGAENFCRNAGGEEPKPWCYTTDPLVRWQHCDIPQCGQSEVEVRLLPMEATFTPGFVLLLAGVGFLSLLILLLFLLLCQRAFKRKHGYQLPSLRKESIDLQKLRDNSTYQCVGARIDPSLEKLEYPRNDIIYIRDIGQGAFGRVFQAKAPNLAKGEACSIVAVKTLKEEADEEMCANFEKEACLLAELDHPNIIGLLGVCAVGKPMCLLLEFMELGDLRQYLRSCCPSNYIAIPESTSVSSTADLSSSRDAVKLSAADLTSMGRQIADGMLYLSQRGFVHRDLATRNCLVSSNGPPSSGGGVTVKIADFGLSQRVHWQQYYYTGTDNDAIPIRWMPLESIIFNRYTTSSDVWAFGVCLWEIFSYAQQPYQGMSHEEVVRYLQSGGMLQPPAHASCAIYAVMRSCWHSSANERPSFVELHDELVAIEEALCCQPRLDTDPPPPVHL